MTQSELAGDPVDAITALALGELPKRRFSVVSRAGLIERIRRGGLPTPAGVTGPVSESVRSQLVGDYVEGVLYHETGKRHDRAELTRMLRYLASVSGTILNVSNVAVQLGVTRDTVVSRLSSLEASFLVDGLAAHRPSEHRSLTAHPKIHASDTAIAAWACRLDDDPPPARPSEDLQSNDTSMPMNSDGEYTGILPARSNRCRSPDTSSAGAAAAKAIR